MQENQPPEKIIDLKDCNIWQQDHLVLSNVNLTIHKGEYVYLVGKVGGGKSSLIKTLNAQLPLKEGDKNKGDPFSSQENWNCISGFSTSH
jgi:ABC-type molybdenum transport system ATPase subunit/photorepair protein PhrA